MAQFEKMKTQCGGERPDSDVAKQNDSKPKKSLMENMKSKHQMKTEKATKKQFTIQQFAKAESDLKVAKENMKDKVSFDNAVKNAVTTAKNAKQKIFDKVAAKSHLCGGDITSYMLNR